MELASPFLNWDVHLTFSLVQAPRGVWGSWERVFATMTICMQEIASAIEFLVPCACADGLKCS